MQKKSLADYEKLNICEWFNIPNNSYIRWIWKKTGKLDKGGWVRGIREQEGNKIIDVAANYVGDSKYDRNVYMSAIGSLYIKRDTSTEPISSIKETFNVQSDICELREDIENINIRLDKMHKDMEDLVEFIKRYVKKKGSLS